MPIVTVSIGPAGPIADVAIAVSGPRAKAMHANGDAIPNPQIIRALIDTGASCTCVDPQVIAQLGLTPTGTCPVLTPTTGANPHTCNQYDVAVVFMMNPQAHIVSMTVPVVESALAHQGYQALIGRDVLSQGILFYNGKEGTMTLSF